MGGPSWALGPSFGFSPLFLDFFCTIHATHSDVPVFGLWPYLFLGPLPHHGPNPLSDSHGSIIALPFMKILIDVSLTSLVFPLFVCY